MRVARLVEELLKVTTNLRLTSVQGCLPPPDHRSTASRRSEAILSTPCSATRDLCDVFQLEADFQAPTLERPHLRLTAANKKESRVT